MYCKLTDQNLKTHHDFQWEIGKWILAQGSGLNALCTDGWLHCYDDPILAILLNPIHANIKNPRLWLVDVGGFAKYDQELKCGFRAMRLVSEIQVPTITTEQTIKFAILCAKSVYKDKKWNVWADKWLSGEDRSKDAAYAAAANAANADARATAYAAAANAANADARATAYAAADARAAYAAAHAAAHAAADARAAHAAAYAAAYAAAHAAAHAVVDLDLKAIAQQALA